MSNTLSILFASPYCLLDTTSGAAITMRTFLTQLANKGLTCEAVTASIFDPPRQVLLDEVMNRCSSTVIAERGRVETLPYIKVSDDKLNHTILKTADSRRPSLTPREEEALLSLVERKIGEFQPNLLLTYGGLSAERRIHRLAKAAKIPVVFYLANALYQKAETFTDVDLILVPSKFLADFYAHRLGLRAKVLRDIFIKDHYIATRKNPRYITYINPVPQKGLTLFARLVAEALRQIPHAEFLVVEGRWNRDDVARVGLRLDRIPNVKVIPNQTDMRRVYAETKILLFPSFWDEASGRTPVEAQLNGIPVLASRRGGIAENLNGGGFLFDIPQRCTMNHMAIPTSEEVQPWIETLQLLLEDNKAYEEAQHRAFKAAEDLIPEKTIPRAIELFQGLSYISRQSSGGKS